MIAVITILAYLKQRKNTQLVIQERYKSYFVVILMQK